jgi:quinohemoprotein ethanol dehydrogenase
MGGGHDWQPMAYHPLNQLVYIPAMDVPNIYSMTPKESFTLGDVNTVSMGAEPWMVPDGDSFTGGVDMPPDQVFLQAWDPVAQREVWRAPHDKRWHGGVYATAGNLVVQGLSTGFVNFYDANSGELLKSIETGTGILAAPMSYEVNGTQYIAVTAGYGGALGRFFGGMGMAQDRYQNYGRILAYKLDGDKTPLPPEVPSLAIPEPPPSPGVSDEILEQGGVLYAAHCVRCHAAMGPNWVYNTYPDLSLMSQGTHAVFRQIVLEGLFQPAGMASFDDLLNSDEVDAIHAWIIQQQRTAFDAQNEDSKN